MVPGIRSAHALAGLVLGLYCSRPPDCTFCARPRRAARRSVSSAQRTHRSLVTTRAVADTMGRRGTHADEDDIAEADDTAGASTFGGASIHDTRQVHRLV